jgi:anti-anti-sigma factor
MGVSVPDAQSFEVTVESSNATPAIIVRGDLDVQTAPNLTSVVREVLDAGSTRVIVDLHDVAFIDSRGMSALVRSHVSATALGTTLSIRGAVGNARRALELCGLLELLER